MLSIKQKIITSLNLILFLFNLSIRRYPGGNKLIGHAANILKHLDNRPSLTSNALVKSNPVAAQDLQHLKTNQNNVLEKDIKADKLVFTQKQRTNEFNKKSYKKQKESPKPDVQETTQTQILENRLQVFVNQEEKHEKDIYQKL